jgi:hypothetical protein
MSWLRSAPNATSSRLNNEGYTCLTFRLMRRLTMSGSRTSTHLGHVNETCPLLDSIPVPMCAARNLIADVHRGVWRETLTLECLSMLNWELER